MIYKGCSVIHLETSQGLNYQVIAHIHIYMYKIIYKHAITLPFPKIFSTGLP